MNPFSSFLADPSHATINVGALLALLACAVWIDIRSRRIPNRLVVLGLAVSFAIQAFSGFHGLQLWSLGLLAGFGLLLPLYLFRAMGAGDVKLMAMVGSFLGPVAALGVVMATLIAGGVLAVLVALSKGAMVQTLRNVQLVLSSTAPKVSDGRRGMQPPAASAGNLPYAIAIAVGTVVHLMLSGSAQALFSPLVFF